MAAERKLKAEIDRTLKKVQEGQEVFADIWNQCVESENQNQREKLEGELKKEIKKLQRLREQIKGWITSADIKDKQPLLDMRKSIERDMERFKALEKEAKAKGYGGMAAAKNDPKERAKEESRDWINNAVDSLTSKNEEHEYEMEELQAGVKKKQKPPARLTELEELVALHKEHILRLEKVLRCLDNDTILPDELEDLRNDMDSYLGSEEDGGGGVESLSAVDDMYASLQDRLEAVDAAAPAAGHGKLAHATIGKAGVAAAAAAAKEEVERERERERERLAAAAARAQLVAQGNNTLRVDMEDRHSGGTRGSGLLVADVKAPGAAVVAGPGGTPRASMAQAAGKDADSGVPANGASSTAAAGGDAAASSSQSSAAHAGGPTSSPAPAAAAAPHAGGRPAAAPSFLTAATTHQPAAADVDVLGRRDSTGAGPNSALPAAAQQPTANQKALLQKFPGQGGQQAHAAAPVPAVATPAAGPALAAAAQQPGASTPRGAAGPQAGGPPGGPQAAAAVATGPNAKPAPAGAAPPAAAAPPGGNSLVWFMQDKTKGPDGQAAAAAGRPAGPAPPDAAEEAPQRAAVASADLLPPKAPPPPPKLGSIASPGGSIAAPDRELSVSEGLNREALLRGLMTAPMAGMGQQQQQPGGQHPPPPPLPMAPMAEMAPLPPPSPAYSTQAARHILEQCYARALPQSADSEWKRARPRHPVATPSSYPKITADVIDNPALFRKVDPECLFFAFYFQPDSYQQYLAALELKRQSWRFHKQHNAWFQRFTEPTLTSDEYEQGAYVYFDYNIVHDDLQTGWCYRRKENFTFKYDALEDELRVQPPQQPPPPPPPPPPQQGMAPPTQMAPSVQQPQQQGVQQSQMQHMMMMM